MCGHYKSIHPHTIRLSIHSSTRLSIIHPSNYIAIHPSHHQSSITPSSIHLTVQYIHPSIITISFIHPSISHSTVYLFIHPPIHHPAILLYTIHHYTIYHSSIHPSIHPPTHIPFDYLSIHSSTCLSIIHPSDYISTVVWKSFCPLPVIFFLNIFLHICPTWMIQIIKQILILHKDNPSKYKMQFWNNDFIY